MSQITSNFDFLDQDFRDLADIAKKAELLYPIDADSCAAKLRLFGELWLYEFNRLSGNKILLKGTFGECISIAKDSDLIDLDYVDLLERLRSSGNIASHVRYCQISQKARFQVITKSQLKANFLSILTLAENIVNKADGSIKPTNSWLEPHDILDAIKFKSAIFDDIESVEQVLELKLSELALLPRTRKRQDLERINSKLTDCEYWLTKGLSLDSENAAFQSYLYFIGYYHPASSDLLKALQYKKRALKNDKTGNVHFFVAQESLKNQDYDKYQQLVKLSIEKSNIKALDHYLTYLVTQSSEEYSKYLQLGISINHLPCLLTTVIYDILSYQSDDGDNKVVLQKNINRQMIKLRAMQSKAASFVEAMFNCCKEGTTVSKKDLRTLVKEAIHFPKYCQASAFTLYIIHKHSVNEELNTQIIKNALAETEGSGISGAIYFFAAIAVYEALSRRTQPLLPGVAPQKLMKKSASLGYEKAIEFEEDSDMMVNPTRKNKVRKTSRKIINARRKQRHR
jgi:hypothetical protein